MSTRNLLIGLLGTLLFWSPSIAPAASREQDGGGYVCPPCGCASDNETFDEAGTCPSCGMTLVRKAALRNVAIVIWNGAEILDFSGPTEVFASARGPGGAFFKVYTVAASAEPIVSQGVVRIVPEYTIDNCPKPDIFALPGGGTSSPLGDPKMIEWVRESAADAEITMSVCTGAYVLARAGLLDGQEATTWHGAIEGLRIYAPDTVVHENRRWVDNGRIVTSAGVSAGIDASLHVVARLCGDEVARSTAEYMEYDWRPEEHASRQAASGGTPQYTSGQRIIRAILADGVEAALALRRETPGTPDEATLPTEQQVNRVGYRYLQDGRVAEAIRIFRFNVEVHPEAFNTWDSLGEAYLVGGQRDRAIRCYRKSLELNPDNDNAVRVLEELQAAPGGE